MPTLTQASDDHFHGEPHQPFLIDRSYRLADPLLRGAGFGAVLPADLRQASLWRRQTPAFCGYRPERNLSPERFLPDSLKDLVWGLRIHL